jgi:predicted AAA+ superfamily ATPase
MKAPKIHYLDNGVLQAVLQKRGGITGAEFESLAIAELYKQANVLQIPAKFHHLRIQGGREIDLLIELSTGYIAFEIKMTDKVSKSDARHFAGLEEILDKPLIHSFILSNDQTTTTFSDKVTVINITMFLG